MPSHTWRAALVIALGAALLGCGSASRVADSGGASPGYGPIPGISSGGGTTMTGSTGSGGSTGTGSGGAPGAPVDSQPGGGIQAGSLTAGTWDDNLNFDFYRSYLARIEGQQIAGLPRIPRENRLAIQVSDEAGAPVAGALVTVSGAGGKLLEAPTRSDGALFFFPGVGGAAAGEDLVVTATAGNATATVAAKVGDPGVALHLAGVTAAPPAGLDLALVIDTTGSMGDELRYLTVELGAIVGRVAQDFPGVAQRWALIVYRDEGDAYVVRTFDFTGALATFQSQLGAQVADGGGDIPEAPERALVALTTLAWRHDAAARMAFWVADAPHHAGHEQTLVGAVKTAQQAGIHIYPVAASGADDLLEYTMRTAAEVTGGRYLFLTDDSGIGNAHKEPTIPCYVVTRLDSAMLRMIAMELTGTEIQPAAGDVIRTGGDPRDRRCTLADGQQVTAL